MRATYTKSESTEAMLGEFAIMLANEHTDAVLHGVPAGVVKTLRVAISRLRKSAQPLGMQTIREPKEVTNLVLLYPLDVFTFWERHYDAPEAEIETVNNWGRYRKPKGTWRDTLAICPTIYRGQRTCYTTKARQAPRRLSLDSGLLESIPNSDMFKGNNAQTVC